MKKPLFLIGLILVFLSDISGQNTSDSTKFQLEGLSQSEIRHLFLSMEESAEVYEPAVSSRETNGQSIRSFVVGGLFFTGGIYALIEASNRPKGISPFNERSALNLLAVMSFGFSIPFILRGASKHRDSKEFLNQAINAYTGE